MSPINPQIITWARARNGIEIDELAERMSKDPSEILAWEQGTKSPSYSLLEDLAYKYLKIPIAVFFFPAPPEVGDPIKKFRRLPAYELARFSTDTLQKLRLGQAYQESLAELHGFTSSEEKIFNILRPDGLSPEAFAEKVRSHLGFSLEKQFTIASCESAFKVLRHTIEANGVFTFKDTFKDRFVSGFSLLDEHFPVILVNNSNSFSRQVFTLIHELGHILYGVHGVTDVDESYLGHMDSSDRAIEIKCNKFAAAFLVPQKPFENDIEVFKSEGTDAIADIADKYSVSREVILRRLLDSRIVTEAFYREMSSKWTQEYLRTKGKGGGGNYYLTKLSYLGEGYVKVAFENYHKGRFDSVQLAKHLNMNSKNIGKLQTFMRW